MNTQSFSETKVADLAANYFDSKVDTTTQEILDSGVIPVLKGFTVIPGKVSDSIIGGRGSYPTKDGGKIEFENPPLNDADDNPVRILVRSERISTHDINRGIIPFKDQVLSINHNFMRKLVAPWMPHAQIDVGLPDSAIVSFAKNVDRFPIENVVRAYMAKTTTETSLYHQYFIENKKEFCGINLNYYENDLRINEQLPFVMDTPSTKSDEHDKSVAPEDLFGVENFDSQYWRSIRNNSLVAFGVVSSYLWQKGIVLVDTKTEHGVDDDGKIWSIDELYTMDSSRFWKMEENGDVLMDEKNEPVSFSKEFARGISRGNRGYTKEQSVSIAVRYMQGIEFLTDKPFEPELHPWNERVIGQINKGLAKIKS